MKIAVCFKIVPEFDQVVDEDWKNFRVDTDLSYVKRVLGCFDEGALESALLLREAWEERGEKTECIALTASSFTSPLYKTLFAAGFDRVINISCTSHAESEFHPRHTAYLLANYLSFAGCDLILAGRQAGYADTGTVPLLLAEILGIPVVTGIEQIAICSGGIEVKRINTAFRERLKVKLPVMAVLGNGLVSTLRAVTLSARIASSKLSAEKLVFSCKEKDSEYRFSQDERHKTCIFPFEGEEPALIASRLLKEYLQKWKQ